MESLWRDLKGILPLGLTVSQVNQCKFLTAEDKAVSVIIIAIIVKAKPQAVYFFMQRGYSWEMLQFSRIVMSVWRFTVQIKEGSNELWPWRNLARTCLCLSQLICLTFPYDRFRFSGPLLHKWQELQRWWCVIIMVCWRWVAGMSRWDLWTHWIYLFCVSLYYLPIYIISYLKFSTCKLTVSNCEACDRGSLTEHTKIY